MVLLTLSVPLTGESWMADNGNGTFTNPLFYDEFSDPDLIRVGDDFYFTGTTMHARAVATTVCPLLVRAMFSASTSILWSSQISSLMRPPP